MMVGDDMEALTALEQTGNRLQGRRAQLFVRVARSEEEIQAAQRLRFRIFTEEFGASLQTEIEGLDVDRYDAHCDHLLVIDNVSAQVIATTRLLNDTAATICGGFYSEGEFDLDNITGLPGKKLEVGRTCVHRDYRNGATLALLWSGIARYVLDHDYDYLLGCGSISVADGFEEAWAITSRTHQTHLIQESMRVFPRNALPHNAVEADKLNTRVTAPPGKVMIPPLIKAYLRLGARIGGDPCWDPHFQCADLFILLEVNALESRYARHFLKGEAKAKRQ